MGYVFEPRGVPSVEIRGTADRFPVHRIYCVARNYAAHAREMGMNPDREPPFFFMKPADAVLVPGQPFVYPTRSSEVHHEVELVVALKSGGADIPAQIAVGHVFGYAVSLDMTCRDLQAEAKRLQRPWEIGKAFDGSAPIGPLTSAAELGLLEAGAITLDVNGVRRQTGDLNQMIWSIAEIIAHVSRHFPLRAGDLIMTGTPAGVGPVAIGDRLVGAIGRLRPLAVDVVAASPS